MFWGRNLLGQQRKQVCSAVCAAPGQLPISEAFMAAWPAFLQPDKIQKNISRWFEEHR